MTAFPRQKTFLDLFPAPEFLRLSNVGVVISDEDIKFAELRREIFRSGFKLVHSGRVPIHQGAIESGSINNTEELTSILKKLSLSHNTRFIMATLPEERAYLFTTSIDRVPAEGLRDAVAFIIEENVPVSLVESVFDFEIIDEDANRSKIKLAVSVLPRSLVSSYIELFESAGITPISFDLESQAIARAVIHRGDKRPHLIVNLSSKKTGFYVVEDEVVQFSTTPAYGVGEDGSYPNLSDLKAEMRKVLAFWNARTDPSNLERKIGKVILCGQGANKSDFVEKLMDGGGVKFALADVWLNITPSRNHVPAIPFEKSLEYASAIGLVLPNKR
ncbi:MAG: pilus assembly protein PilM [Minisyncoccia bacterium]